MLQKQAIRLLSSSIFPNQWGPGAVIAAKNSAINNTLISENGSYSSAILWLDRQEIY
jgi:hypothetical protein